MSRRKAEMYKAIGMVEVNSIAIGVNIADVMVKAAEVTLIMSKTICPGKFLILIAGDVGAINSSVEAGVAGVGENVVDKLILPNVHPQVINAMSMTTEINKVNALGVVEYFSIATAIVGADAAAKAANIKLIELRPGLGIGGKAFVSLSGDVSAVTESVNAAARVGEENGMLVAKVVIPSPSKEVFFSMV